MERAVAQRVRAQRWYLRFPRGVPVAIFLLVSAITALSVFAIERVENQRSEAQHRQIADTMVAALERLANANAVYLQAGASLISLRGEVSQATFNEFARQLDQDDSLRSGGAMAYAPLVDRAGVPAFEAGQRRLGRKGFTVYPAGTAPTALPVLHIEPDTPGNRRALGYDILSEPVRRAAVLRAARTGRPTASGSMDLVAGAATGNRTGFAIVMPVYAGPPSLHRLRGVIARGFNAQSFLDTALGPDQLHTYGVALFDAETPTPTLLVARGTPGSAARRAVRFFTFADHRMRLEVSAPDSTALSSLSLLTLVFGMMVAALLLVVARLVTQQAAEDRAALAWFEEQASIRNSLTRELNHRVKNTLANVLSIVSLTRRRTDDINQFVAGLSERIRALSATHDLLTQSEWGTTPIRAVIDAELAPYARDADAGVQLRGPHVELAPNDALSLGLAIHELATNASKYGALSAPGGRVEIDWALLSDTRVQVDWQELGGPPVAAARRRGFGTELIEKIVAHELRNPVDLRFAPEGVHCRMIVPVRVPAAFQMRAARGPGDD